MNKSLTIIDGPPWVGKSTLAQALLSKFHEIELSRLESYTTRKRRFPEESEHHFIWEDEFISLMDRGKFLAVGLRTRALPDYCWVMFPLSNHSLWILWIDGARKAKQYCVDHNIMFLHILLQADRRTLETRLLKRWENEASLEQKLIASGKWDENEWLLPKTVILDTSNQDIETIVRKVSQYISEMLLRGNE